MTNWRKRTQPIQVGDRVGYSKQFLQSTGQFTGDIPFLRGTVKVLREFGEDCVIAEVQWDGEEELARVHVNNLSTIRRIQLGE